MELSGLRAGPRTCAAAVRVEAVYRSRSSPDAVAPTGILIGIDREPAQLALADAVAPAARFAAARAESLPIATCGIDVAFVHTETDGRLPIIGVGGVMCADDASRLFDAGASLVQLYSGFIYHGPALVRSVARAAASRRARSSV